MSQYPISCIPCRRRKVRCNRRKPCNWCVKNGLKCEFPTKFRNIELRSGGLETPTDNYALAEEVAQLRKEKQLMANRVKELEEKVAGLGPREGEIQITGETTELGEKYYGPLLSNYMIDMLQREKDRTPLSENVSDSKSSLSLPVEEPEKDNETDESGQAKKKLPFLLAPGSSDEDNLLVLIFLVQRFFSLFKYANFISQPLMINFVKNNNLIKEDEWENDDDLLLLHMILILLLRRLTPQDYDNSGLSSTPISSMTELTLETNRLIDKILSPEFIRLRHNLLNESVVTVQAHILCIEWHVIERLYEEAWSMMFHSCSIAYSIGLHVMFNLRTASKVTDKTARQITEMTEGQDSAKQNEDDDDKEDTTNLSDDEDDNEDYRMARFKVWFALKHISGQLCSMLGRPSPILIQVNLLVLLSASSASLSKMELGRKETQSHLKMGLSECIRLSNVMLIESFMMNFSLNDIMQLEVRFKEESKDLNWFASGEYQASIEGKENEINQYSDIPLHVDRREALSDLVCLHVNRAKLLQPFMSQFLGSPDNDYLLEAMCESIREFLRCVLAFVKVFLQHQVPKFVNSKGQVIADVRLNKSLKSHHPFVETFIYQGLVVLFTFLSYKAAEFLKEIFVDFIKEIRSMLGGILELNSQCQDLLQQTVNFWPQHIVFLVTKNIQYADQIYKRFEESLENQSLNSDVFFGSDLTEPDSLVGFNIDDPFWITNPENLPYYLNNPSDEEMQEQQQQQQNYSRNKAVSKADAYQVPLLLVTPEQTLQDLQLLQPSEFSNHTVVPDQTYLELEQPTPLHTGDQVAAQDSAIDSALSYVSMGFQSVPEAISALTSSDQVAGDQTYKAESVSSGLDVLLTQVIEQNQI